MSDNFQRVDGLYAKIQSGYYLVDANGKKINSLSPEATYLYIKEYIQKIKSDDDIIVYNDSQFEIIINTLNKQLPLDRYVKINTSVVNLENLSSNIKK